MIRLATVFLIVLSLGACAQQSYSSQDAAEIAARSGLWESALNAGDIDAIVALYTSDARLLSPNAELAEGADAVRADFGGMISAGLKVDLETIEARMAGDIGFRVGTYVLYGPDDSVVDRGKYVETWRLEDGEWRIANDIYNSDMPATTAPEARMSVTHEVRDAAHWLAAWKGENNRHQLFAKHGAEHVHVFQDTANPNRTGLVISVADMKKFQAFLESPEGAAAKQADGVIDDTMQVYIEVD